MKLIRVDIKNFRSIKDTKVELKPSCRVLVGINESGKSNILKAFSLLDEGKTTTPADVRFPLEDESPVEEAFVRFIFALDEGEISQIYENVLSKILRKKNDQKVFLKEGNKDIELKVFCSSRSEGIYQIDVSNSSRNYMYWRLKKGKYTIGKEWAIPSKIVTDDFLIEVKKEQKPLKDFVLINVNDYPEIPESNLSVATVDDISTIIGNMVLKVIGHNLPNCVYWIYNEQNLLPASITISSFVANPASCIPLKNMFELAGIENIEEAFETEQGRPNGLRNLLGRVAKQTTQHIKSVWQEYKSIEILLEPNGGNIDASVKEDFNRYDFASRSDGFKRFVSFLIMVSAKVKTNKLENTLILIDEPEIGLHPSGARYLKDELIKISEKNHVVYSTHSIFMVDKEDISRHLIVKKQNEVTEAMEVTQSNFVDEEVIYNAIGYSIFENLKEMNILFEGWRDKKIFQVALVKIPASHKKIKGAFQKIGVAHLQGATDVGRVCPILELANRNYIIVSDCDQAAKAEQKKFSGSGLWKRWDELSNDAEIVTGEDFIKIDHITSMISKIRDQYPQLSELDLKSLNLNAGGGKLYCIDRWIGKAMSREEKKLFFNHLKDQSANLLTPGDIEDCFYGYLLKLLEYTGVD